MNRQIVILVLAIVLIALVGVQTIQINGVRNDILDGTIGVSGSAVKSQNSLVGNAPQQNNPTMVGGC